MTISLENFTTTDLGIMERLAEFRIMNTDQMWRCIPRSREYVQRRARFLSRFPQKQPFLRCGHSPVHARCGKLAHLYSLSPLGLQYAKADGYADEGARVFSPRIGQDYFHRVAVVDFHIALSSALAGSDWRIALSDQYFDMSGANHRVEPGPPLTANTKIVNPDGSWIIPDSIFLLRWREIAPLLLVMEYVRGRNWKRTLNQISQHVKVLHLGSMAASYDLPPNQDHLVLFVFEDPRLLERSLEHLSRQAEFVPFRDHFLFTSAAETRQDVLSRWQMVGDPHFCRNVLSGQPTYPV